MKHMVLVLASGIPRKWKSDDYPIKFLIPIAKEPLIARTVRMLMERDIIPIVVTHFPEVAYSVPLAPVLLFEESTTRYVETIMKTTHLWAGNAEVEKLTVLHGDVIWDDPALDFVLSCEASPVFFGSVTGNVHGFGAVADGFLELVHAAESTDALWASGFYHRFGTRDGTPNRYHQKIPSGFSTDFDSWGHYQGWLASREWAR